MEQRLSVRIALALLEKILVIASGIFFTSHCLADTHTSYCPSISGLSDVTGSLEKGKQADMVAVKISCLECQPAYNLASHLVYSAGREWSLNLPHTSTDKQTNMCTCHSLSRSLMHPYTYDRSSVSDVWVAGKQLLKDRQLTTIDQKVRPLLSLSHLQTRTHTLTYILASE